MRNTGFIEFIVPGIGMARVSKEKIRRMYYKVLGLRMPDKTLDDELADVRYGSYGDVATFSVDRPEDILVLEKLLEEQEEATGQRTGQN